MSTGDMIPIDRDALQQIWVEAQDIAALAARALDGLDVDEWAYPVGTEQYPPRMWYCAQYHGQGGHTGIDLNLDVAPWGNVDLGKPTFAITAGTVHEVGYSASWGCNVVLLVRHDDKPLWVRYAHLDRATVTLQAGNPISAGQKVGGIGPHPNGAHLHFDMAIDAFGWPYYRTTWVRWVDPVPILKAHLDPPTVDAMLKKNA